MRVFIIWSGDKCKAMAEALHDWLPDVIQTCKPWISSKDIGPGKRWNAEIAKQLDKTDFGIICLTQENLHEPWIHFEAGALAKRIDEARVCPYLLDLKTTDIKGPLESFHAKIAGSKDDIKDIVQEIYNASGEHDLTPDRLNRAFERNWDRLNETLKNIQESTQTVNEPHRGSEDIIEEVLGIVRDQSKILVKMQDQIINIDKGLLDYLQNKSGAKRLIKILVDRARLLSLEQLLNEKFVSKNTTYDSFEELIKDIEGATGSKIATQDDLITSLEWPEPTKSRSKFPDGSTMIRAALDEWVQDFLVELGYL